MKFVLTVFNFLIAVIGIAVMGLGIYMVVTEYGVQEVTYIIDSDLYKAGSYLMIAVGGVTFFISFLGFCGAVMESRCLLGIYFGILLILSILYLAILIIGFVFRRDIGDHLVDEAKQTLIYGYGENEDITAQWDEVQAQLKCCGVTGDVNSETSWAIYKLSSDWYMKQAKNAVQYSVPISCCPVDEDVDECRNKDNAIPKVGPPLNSSMANNTLLYTEGCYDKLDGYLETNALKIGIIALAALIIMVLGVIFSICLFLQIGRQGYVV